LQPYPIYGVTIAEVEIDLLTGQHIIRRVDMVEDCGVSLNPEVDLGQVEGAFIMGVGYWTSEELVYDPRTGALTNDRTWVRMTYIAFQLTTFSRDMISPKFTPDEKNCEINILYFFFIEL